MICPAWSFTAQMLEERVANFEQAIARRRPRVLGLLADNGSDWLAADLAAERAGVPIVPLPAFFTPAQARHAADSTGMDALICASRDTASELGFGVPDPIDGSVLGWSRRNAAPVALPPATSKISFTSGTTGTPKGVCLSADQQHKLARTLAHTTRGLGLARHLCLLPLPVLLENVAGARTALVMGAACATPPLSEIGMSGASGFDAAACLAAIERCQADSVILLPQTLLALTAALEAGAPRPGKLRFAAVGGARVAPALIDRARAAGLPVFEGYGLTECASVVALNLPGADRVGTVGRPLPHARVRIAENGEILVGGNGCLGYTDGTPGAPVDDAWLQTGDSGRIDGDGFLHIEGRRKHLLITSFGRNVSPEWPESALVAGGAIMQAAVFGEARPRLCAVVVPRHPDMSDAAIQAEVGHANGQLPDYARVASWIRAEAPFTAANGFATANGRIRRDEVWARYGPELDFLYSPDHPAPESPMCFYEDLQLRTADERETLLAIPVIRDCLAGGVTLEQYIAFLAQAYHHVKHTVPLLMACGARLPDTHAWLRSAIAHYITEETGHEEWILNDIAAAGGDAGAVRASAPGRAAELLVAYAYDYVSRRNPVGFFGMVYVLEGTSQAIATRAAQSMRACLGLPPEAFTYLTSHGALDQEHVRFFADLMNRLEDPDDREAVSHVARRVFLLYGDIFRDLPVAARKVTA